MSREKMAQAIVQGWDGAPEAHLVARIVEALAAVERETIGRAAKIANKWDSFVAKQILEAIQDFQQDGSPPERKPSALRPEEEGTEAGDMSRTAAPLGAPKSTSSKAVCSCNGFMVHADECGLVVAEREKRLAAPTQTVLNGCNHTARRALCDECFQKAMALACEAGRGLTVVHYTDKDIPRLLSEIARLKTAKAPAAVDPSLGNIMFVFGWGVKALAEYERLLKYGAETPVLKAMREAEKALAAYSTRPDSVRADRDHLHERLGEANMEIASLRLALKAVWNEGVCAGVLKTQVQEALWGESASDDSSVKGKP